MHSHSQFNMKSHTLHIVCYSPQCTFRFKQAYKGGQRVIPNVDNCPLCNFDFDQYQQWGFQLGLYYQKTSTKPPKFLQPQIQEFNDNILYNAVYKKFCTIMYVFHAVTEVLTQIR